jgi:D-sedoheptulose 7-phosphate isomerase
MEGKWAMRYDNLIIKRLKESGDMKNKIAEDPELLGVIIKIAEIIIEAYRNGKKVILFGNGGSAADAQHITAELVGKYYLDRDPLPAVALTTNTSSLTAIGNDYSFDIVFTRQLKALGQKGDVVIGISTSGNSENVIQAFKVAREMGLITVGFTGKSGGKLRSVADHCLCISSDDTPRIQEGHITIGHIICEIVERELFCSGASKDA